ncbi:hypothetical protein Bca4012_081931 [Brassica carinata]
MGRYSYSQPSSSSNYGYDFGEESSTEDLIRRDQEELELKYGAPSQYPPHPEVEFGFPHACYCGGEPVLSTRNYDAGRLYYTCAARDDGECHVWKWWDKAVMEEMRAMDQHVNVLAEKVDSLTGFTDYETEQRILRLENLVTDLAKKRPSGGMSGFERPFGVMLLILVFIGLIISFK